LSYALEIDDGGVLFRVSTATVQPADSIVCLRVVTGK
jgi:hypothetical protein